MITGCDYFPGYYAYIEGGTDTQSPSDVAKLSTTFIQTTAATDMCFTFWYNMHGDLSATLQLYKWEYMYM